MDTLHPFFVHFPIAFLLLAPWLELYGALRKQDRWQQLAYGLWILGSVGILAAAVSGQAAETALQSQEALLPAVSGALERHTTSGNLLAWIVIGVTFLRGWAWLEKKQWARAGWLPVLLSFLLAGAVLLIATWGAELRAAVLAALEAL